MSEPIYNKEIRISEETYNRLTELADAYKLSYDDTLRQMFFAKSERIFTKEEGYMLLKLLKLYNMKPYTTVRDFEDRLKQIMDKVKNNTNWKEEE